MRKSKLVALIAFLLIVTSIVPWESQVAAAAQKNGALVTLTQVGQVLDTITYNGITVEAVYTNGPHSGSDVTYSCAAFVKKFYSAVYGVSVYNLNSTVSIPLVYNNKGSFSLTDQPRVGDIVRDNSRTHWAIVKSITGDTITLIQQNYRSGTMAWTGCTVDRKDTGYSYFTYSSRIEDGAGEEVKTDMPATVSALLPDGTYELFQASTMNILNAPAEATSGKVLTVEYDGSDRQKLSIVNMGKDEYSMQFLSNQRFLGVSEEGLPALSDILSQRFVFVDRGNGLHTISPANNRDYVVTSSPSLSGEGQNELVIREYTGAVEELWFLNQSSAQALVLIPKEMESKRTLYTGYQDDLVRINQRKDSAVVSYSSNAPEIASVDKDGTVRPLQKGEAIILIQVLQDNTAYQLSVTVTVKDPYLKLTASDKELAVGNSMSIKVKKYGTKDAITWQVSDKSIATIHSKTGELSAKKPGTVTITAKTESGLTANIKIKVI
jgi:hypothetical protein